MQLFVFTFSYVNDSANLTRLRPARYEFFESTPGILVSGPMLEVGEGLLICAASSREQAEQLLNDDPYVQHNLVAERRIQPFEAASGSLADAFANAGGVK